MAECEYRRRRKEKKDKEKEEESRKGFVGEGKGWGEKKDLILILTFFFEWANSLMGLHKLFPSKEFHPQNSGESRLKGLRTWIVNNRNSRSTNVETIGTKINQIIKARESPQYNKSHHTSM